jgi:dephospho-CoA kinase
MAGGMQAELNARLISQLPTQGDCVVDGLRHPLDYDSLNDAFALRFYMVYVSSSPELRWRRLQSRYPEPEDFGRADSHPVEQQIDSLRDKAFAVLNNQSSLQSLYSTVDAVLEKIRAGGSR